MNAVCHSAATRHCLIACWASALGPFAIDTYLPSFSDIGAFAGGDYDPGAADLTAYLLPFAVMALWHGAIADALGRRRVVLVALACFGLAMFGCLFATRIEHLWVLRALQGMTAGAGIVISRAIVRDLRRAAGASTDVPDHDDVCLCAGAGAGHRRPVAGIVRLAFGLCLPGVVQRRRVVCLLASVARDLAPDKRQPLAPSYLARTYWRVLTSPLFLTACGLGL